MVETDLQSTLDLLDALEAALASGCARSSPAPGSTTSAELLCKEMDLISLSPAEFASLFGVSADVVRAWMAGHGPVPSWARSGVRLLCLLAPPVRRKILHRPEPVSAAPGTGKRQHPFSRIEEL